MVCWMSPTATEPVTDSVMPWSSLAMELLTGRTTGLSRTGATIYEFKVTLIIYFAFDFETTLQSNNSQQKSH